METLINNDCTEIEITSDILLLTNTLNKLTVIFEGVSKDVNIPLNIDSFTLLPNHLDMEEKFTDGVYTIKLTNTLSSGSIQESQKCAIVLCSYNCSENMFSIYNEQQLDKVLTYEALKIGKDCSTCSCSTLENLFIKLTENESNNCGSCCCQV